jgi:hypothetical protein
MAGTKPVSVNQLIRLAAQRAFAQRGQQLEDDLTNFTQVWNTVQLFRIWERYSGSWAHEFVKAYAEYAREFGVTDAFAPQHLRSVRSAIQLNTQIGIGFLRRSVDEEHARTAGYTPLPAPASYESLLAKVMAEADVEIAARAAEVEVRPQPPYETTPDADHNRVAASDPPFGAQEQRRSGKRLPRNKPIRRNAKYEEIDRALREIADAVPRNHEGVFQLLDERTVGIPNRKPFKGAGGWLKGFRQNQPAARVWLSQNQSEIAF